MIDKTLSIFGLGKLGSAMLASFAHKSWNVIGVDINPFNVKSINEGKSPVYEPHIEDLIKSNKERIYATGNATGAVRDSCTSFIVVPTPSIEDGSFSIRYVEDVCIKIGEALKHKTEWHLVVITSTVLSGDCDKLKSQIECISGKKCGKDFGLCYNPDFIAIGRIVRDFLNPDMVLIGESDSRSGQFLESLHRSIVDSEPSFHRMSLLNAELAKISLNTYCTMKISFANIIGEACESIPGGNAKKVLAAIGSDSRVGRKYLNAGLGYGGPCFPRDSRALGSVLRKFGIPISYCDVTDQINSHQIDRICNKVLGLAGTDGTVAVLGLGYKEDVAIVDESVAIKIIRKLSEKSHKIQAYDPAAMKTAASELSAIDGITFHKTPLEALTGADVCFIATPWPEFRNLTEDDFLTHMKNPVVLDAWGMISEHWNSVHVHQIGYNE